MNNTPPAASPRKDHANLLYSLKFWRAPKSTAPHAAVPPPSDRDAARAKAEALLAPLRSGPDARWISNYLVPKDPRASVVRVSRQLAHGGFSSIHVGIDASGRQSIWRGVRVNLAGSRRKGALSLEQVRQEMLCLADVGSPLLPLRSQLDRNGLFFTELPVFAADLDQMADFILPVGDALDVPVQATQKAIAAAIVVGKDVARSLVTMHERGWVHRDIKPENIFYNAQRGAVLADYGLAASTGEVGFVSGMCGTPLYMAPEATNATGDGALSYFASDIFSLGVSLAEIVSGGRIFDLPLFSKDELPRHLGLLELRGEVSPFLTNEPTHELITPARAYKYFAQASVPFAALLFGSALSAWPHERSSASEFLCRLEAIQPNGSEADVAGAALLRTSAGQFEAMRDAARAPSTQFRALRQQPADPFNAEMRAAA